MVADGTFREDLYYRLNVVNLEIPPLREHKEDIEHLANIFAAEFKISSGGNRNHICCGQKIAITYRNSCSDSKKCSAKGNAPQKTSGLGMLSKIATAKDARQTEENNKHRKQNGISPAGFHHKKSKEQNGEGHE